MRMEKLMCNFQNCKYHQDGNCVNASRYENCDLTDLHYEIARLRVDHDNAKADTVRKIIQRIKEDAIAVSLLSHPPKFMLEIREDALDQIAKEMLEGKG